MGIREAVAKDRLKQFDRAGEVPAHGLKTAFAERQWEPGNSVKAPACDDGVRYRCLHQ